MSAHRSRLPDMRLVRRASGFFDWVHRLEMLDTDVDCTDMSDADFEQFVRENSRSVA